MIDEYFPIEFETDEAMEAELGETFPVPVRANYNQTDPRALDYIIGREKILGKSDIPLDKGSAEGSVQTGQSEALSPYSFALGAQNASGSKGYYVWKLDPTNLTITLARTKEEAQKTEVEPAAFETGYAAGDQITLNCNYEYVDCSKIIEISGNVIKVDSLPPYYSENNGTNYNQWSDKDTLFVNNTIYCTAKPMVGLADIGIGAHSEGVNNQSIGYGSHSEGSGNIAKGANSHTEGAENSAEYCAHAEGRGNQALGLYSHAEGRANTALGDTAHAEGWKTNADGDDAHAEGYQTRAGGVASHAEGGYTQALHNYAHAEGYKTVAEAGENVEPTDSADGAHAEGYETKAKHRGTHAEGIQTEASGRGAHAEGIYPKATYDAAHAEGWNTVSSGWGSHAEGFETHATSRAAHAEGCQTNASHYYSHAEGWGTKTSAKAQHVEGAFNKDEETAYHIIGCGTGDADAERDNCFTSGVTEAGEKYIKIGGTMITEAQLIKLIALIS